MQQNDRWPPLALEAWRDTYQTLHMWTQIVGKMRMKLAPPQNHWWQVALYVNARGLTTGPIPYEGGLFEIQFDFDRHELEISATGGGRARRPLRAEPVAEFYTGLRELLASIGIRVEISTKPQEVADPIPFEHDQTHRSYDAEAVGRFWRVLQSTHSVLNQFRSGFVGKCSPVHFFWGSFDLCCTRFSGREAPPRKGVISGPAYSHEVWSAGFWPGGGMVDGPAFYAYAVPSPAGWERETVLPPEAKWNGVLGEYLLMYEDMRQSPSPDETLYRFLATTYDAAARMGNWDRNTLEAAL